MSGSGVASGSPNISPQATFFGIVSSVVVQHREVQRDRQSVDHRVARVDRDGVPAVLLDGAGDAPLYGREGLGPGRLGEFAVRAAHERGGQPVRIFVELPE
jgi:hypothetical protein